MLSLMGWERSALWMWTLDFVGLSFASGERVCRTEARVARLEWLRAFWFSGLSKMMRVNDVARCTKSVDAECVSEGMWKGREGLTRFVRWSLLAFQFCVSAKTCSCTINRGRVFFCLLASLNIIKKWASDDDEVLERPDFRVARMPTHTPCIVQTTSYNSNHTIATHHTKHFKIVKKFAMLFRMKCTKRL